MSDPYEILGVERDADISMIRKAYKNLAKKLHPDKTRGNMRALEQMKTVNDAYATLCKNLQKGEAKRINEEISPKYVQEVWNSYSRQVEEYYQQVQEYLQDKMKDIEIKRSLLEKREKDLTAREGELRKREGEVRNIENKKKKLERLKDSLLKREEVISSREDQLDELLLCISRANAITVELAQTSKSLNRKK